jgi:hypothetical protein
MPEPLTIAQLQTLPDEELIKQHDAIIATHNIVVGVQYFLDELRRRESSRQQETMLAYTRQIRVMTVIVTVATIVNVLVAVALLYHP